ncbi:hypothetical protein ISP15_05475 [Dyella jejuensis]|uniref:Uncharacterized protein n=1 Tax=Dyella jejuensis TaxID=1432009 RepID=A0ABW8JJ06_9GAMM
MTSRGRFERDPRCQVPAFSSGTIEQAKQAYVPVNELARAQGELAGRQGELAGQQSGLAARQSALASRQAELESRRASIEAQRIALQVSGSSQEGLAEQASLHGLNQENAEIARETRTLDQSAATLSRQQAQLSVRESELSKQEKLATQRANQQLDKLLDDAVTNGMAEPVNH